MLKRRIPHADNQDYLVDLVKSRFKGTALSCVAAATTIVKIDEIVVKTFKGPKPVEIRSELMVIKKSDQMTKEIELLAEKLQNAYIGNGHALEHANELTVETVKEVLEKQAGDNPVNKNMFIKEFPTVNSVIEVYNALEKRKQSNSQISINHVRGRGRQNQHPRGF